MPEEGPGRVIYLFGEICEEMAEQFIYDLNDLAKSNPKKEIEVMICTEGGCVYSMFAMHDVMRSIETPICTIGVGKIMSAGTLLLSAGDRRLIFPHASVMIHEPISESMEASYSQIKNEIKHFEDLQSQMLKLYSEYTGKTVEQIGSDLHKEDGIYLTAQEAIEYGLADEICTLRKRSVPKKQKPSRRKSR